MQKYVFKYTFNGKRYMSEIEASSLYAAHIAFKKFIEDRTIIESVQEKEEVREDKVLNDLRKIFGI